MSDSDTFDTTSSSPGGPEDAGGPGRGRGRIADGLERATRKKFTEPPPATAREQVAFLLSKVKGGTRALAARLGISQRSVQRYAKGTVTTPRAATREVMEDDTASQWQPEVRSAVRAQAAAAGMTVEVRGTFGFSAGAGTTDDPRVRWLTERISAHHTAEILAAQENGATETELHQLVADALAEAYFTDSGSRASGLQVELRDVQYLDFAFD